MTIPPTSKSAHQSAVALNVIAVVAVLAALYFGRVAFMPIVLALMLTTIFRPVVRWFEKLKVSSNLTAPVVVIAAIVVVATVVRTLAGPVGSFAHRVPDLVDSARVKIAVMPHPFNNIATAIPDLHDVLTPTDSADAAPMPKHPTPQLGAGKAPSMGPIIGRVFGTATGIVTGLLQTILLLIFFLAGGREWRKRLGKGPGATAIIEVGDQVQESVSRYLIMTGLINLFEGFLVFLAMWAAGLPAPVMWGVFTFLFEFFPYLGGLSMVALLSLVGLATSDSVGHALLGPGLYLIITTLQNNLVSPVVYGRRLKLNPAAILISVIFWLFIWGAAGAFLAVPILATLRIVCDRQGGALQPLADLISG